MSSARGGRHAFASPTLTLRCQRVPARAANRGRDLRPQHMPFVLPFGGHDGVGRRTQLPRFRKNQSCELEGYSVDKGRVSGPMTYGVSDGL